MRGKLRDKRTKYDSFKREAMDRKRPGKRDIRMAILLDQELEDQNLSLEDVQDTERDDNSVQADPMLIRFTKLAQK